MRRATTRPPSAWPTHNIPTGPPSTRSPRPMTPPRPTCGRKTCGRCLRVESCKHAINGDCHCVLGRRLERPQTRCQRPVGGGGRHQLGSRAGTERARTSQELGPRVPRPRQRPARREHRDLPERRRHPRHVPMGADRDQQRHPRHGTQRQADRDDRHRGLDRGRRKATARLGRAGLVRALSLPAREVTPAPGHPAGGRETEVRT